MGRGASSKILIVFLFAIPLLQGCDVEREIEKVLGVYSQFYVSLVYTRSKDPVLAELTESVGSRIREVTPRKDMPIKYGVLDSGEINAFALSNGRIYVLRGLMEMMETEDELASVLAHEAGHVAARHTLKDFRRNLLVSTLADLGDLEKQSRWVQASASLIWSLTELAFSRQQEYDADRYGLRLALIGRYDPRGSVDLFDKFAKREGRPSRVLVFLSTHPPAVDRVERARAGVSQINRIVPQLDAVSAHTLIGDGYLQRSLFRQALAHYQRALEKAPDYVPALLGSGKANEAWGNFKAAKEAYEKVLQREPDHPEAREGLERVRRHQARQEASFDPDPHPLSPLEREALVKEILRWQVLLERLEEKKRNIYSATNAIAPPLY
ncbi:MAG: M48 family metalloprotease, partial [Armatimonadetes bacterium]|nr:M48 family metalloprotease [Armatimonadota bacterium]MDW8122346.1 M48 family metalloprotease [Armatimonadota bacterium]